MSAYSESGTNTQVTVFPTEYVKLHSTSMSDKVCDHDDFIIMSEDRQKQEHCAYKSFHTSSPIESSHSKKLRPHANKQHQLAIYVNETLWS